MNSLHGNIKVEALPVRYVATGTTAMVTGSQQFDLRGFSSAEIAISRNGTARSLSAANSIYFYLRHGNTAGAAQVAVAAGDVITDALGAAGVSGGNLTQLTTTGRIYTARETFSNVGRAAWPQASVTLAKDNIRVGYKGNRRYLRVGYVSSGAAASNTGPGTGYGRMSITVIAGRPAQAPIPVPAAE